MRRALAVLGLLFAGCVPAVAGSVTLLGAGSAGGGAAANCNSFLPAAFNSSALYISWTTQAPDTSWGMACLSGTTAVAANTLGTFSGAAAAGSTGLVLTGGFFQFSNVTWLAQGSGTLYSNMIITTYSAATVVLFSVHDGSNNNFTAIRSASASRNLTGIDIVGNVTQSNITSGFTNTSGVGFKSAYSYTAGTQIVCAGASAAATGAGVSVPASLTQSNIGASATGIQVVTGTVTETAFFSTALASTAACNTLTTP